MSTGNWKQQADDLEVELRSKALKDVRIGLCVGGGIAAIEVPRVARELRRKGALVRIYATENALRFVGREALEWASAHPVVVHPSGLAEHIATEDLVLILPATTDLIAKAAHGICPDACTTYIQSALGLELPIYVMATMHNSLRQSPAFKANLERLTQFTGVELLPARTEEGKWKVPAPEQIAREVAYRFNSHRMLQQRGKRVKALVTLGGTSVPIDSARSITNASSGSLGSLIAERLLDAGIETTTLCGNRTVPLPTCSGLKVVEAQSFEDFATWIELETNTNDFDALFHVAAVSDFKPSQSAEGKIDSSSAHWTFEMEQLPKLIKHKNLQRIQFKMACKFTFSDSDEEQKKAFNLLNDNALSAVYWNWGTHSFGTSGLTQGVLLTHQAKDSVQLNSKLQAATHIVELFTNGN